MITKNKIQEIFELSKNESYTRSDITSENIFNLDFFEQFFFDKFDHLVLLEESNSYSELIKELHERNLLK